MLLFGGGGLRDDMADQLLRAIDQHARRLVCTITPNQSAVWIRRVAPNLGQSENFRASPRRMPIDATERNRVVGADRVEFLRGWKNCRMPETLVPASASYPGDVRRCASGVCNLRQYLSFR